MNSPKINYLAVLLSAVAMWVIGGFWYTLLSDPWMEYTGVTMKMAEEMSMQRTVLMYAGTVGAFALFFYVMAHFMSYMNINSIKDALKTGFWIWLGFVSTVIFVQVLYSMHNMRLWFIDAIYWLLGILLGSIILYKMKKKDSVTTSAV